MSVRGLAPILVTGALLLAACTSDDGVDGSGGPTTTAAPETVAALVDACERNAPPGAATERCAEVVDEALALSSGAGCGSETTIAGIEVSMSAGLASGPPEDFVERCPVSLSSMAIVDAPSGFVALLPGQPEVGIVTPDSLAALYVETERWRDFLDEAGYLGGASRHWRLEGSASDSLVVRIDRFATVVGAFSYSNPEGEPSTATTVDGALDARLVSSRTGVGHEQRIVGRVCDVVITVVARSSESPRDDDELIDVFGRQAERVSDVVTC
ncbi:MAG: hypothetical protein ACXIVQ_06645 [Acidimicrobiales bacterium]